MLRLARKGVQEETVGICEVSIMHQLGCAKAQSQLELIGVTNHWRIAPLPHRRHPHAPLRLVAVQRGADARAANPRPRRSERTYLGAAGGVGPPVGLPQLHADS